MLDSIYFARAADGSIKVGRSTDVPQRIATLRCPEGGRVELIASFDAVGKYEKTVHRALKESALGGEWFAPSPLIQRLMSARNAQAMLTTIGVQPRNIGRAHEGATDADRADLAEAARMVKEGKALRRRVLARIRNRRYRKGKSNGKS